MKKFLLSIAAVFLTMGAMAQTSYSLKFDRNRTTTKDGLTISVINPKGEVVEGVNATLTELSHDFMETKGDSYNDTIICPNANANTNPTIKLKFEITGLSTGFNLNTIGLDIHPLNNVGNTQSNTTNRKWNVGVNINENLFGELQDVDIAYGAPYNTGMTYAHKTHYIENANGVATKGSVAIELTITRGTDNPGCFFGLSEIILAGEIEEVIEPEPEPTPVAAFYHLSGKNLTADELMTKTEPTYIAIKGLANKNNEYWNYVSGDENTSTQYFNQNAIFVWEPVNDGVAGSYYLRKLNSGYMQASNPGTYAETTEGAAVFTAVKPTEVASGANGEGQFNRDANSVGFIAAAGGYDYIVRLVTNGKWLNIGDRLTSAQAPAFNNGYGTFTIYQICELKGFEANINVTIKNTGDVDYATFYCNAPVQMPAGVTAYYVKEDGINNGYITLAADEDGIIAGNTGVILSTTADADAEVALTVLGANVAAENGNLLKGTAEEDIIVKEDGKEYYVLADGENGLGFYVAGNGGDNTAFKNWANKAYLVLPKQEDENAAYFSFRFPGTTAIEGVEVENEVKAIYDLTGRRVEAITAPGIYIVNGKKVLVK